MFKKKRGPIGKGLVQGNDLFLYKYMRCHSSPDPEYEEKFNIWKDLILEELTNYILCSTSSCMPK